MSILETFYIVFKSDSSDLKKGAEEAEKTTKRLDERLKDVGTHSATAGRNFLNMARSAQGVLASLVSVGAVLSDFKHTINSVSELGAVSRELQVNAESLDAWGHAVQRTGGNAAQFQSTLKNLAGHLNTSPATALKALPALADSFARMNQAQANQYGKSLGIDQSTIYLLQQGRREVEATIKQQKELGLVTQKDTEITQKFDNSLYDLGRVFQTISREFVIPKLPFITETFNYLIEHKDLIKGAMIAIGAGVATMAASFALANPAITAITLALSAFALAYEDIQKFRKGLPSVTEYFTDQNIIKQIESITPAPVLKAAKFIGNDFSALQKRLSGQFSGIGAGTFLDKYASPSGNNTTINVGDVTIETNATDAQGVASGFKGYLDHLFQANSQADSGVTI